MRQSEICLQFIAMNDSRTGSLLLIAGFLLKGIATGSIIEEVEEETLEATPLERCYADLGCFDLEYPWLSKERPFPKLPDHPAVINTTFYLSTRKFRGLNRLTMKTRPQISIDGSDWSSERWTVIITHGFLASADISWVRDLEQALLEIKDMNVVSCDWSKGSSGISYVQAAVNARVVGAEVTRLLKYLYDTKLASRDRTHLIGQSLGAHVLSYVSASIKNISRLTALDPAQPGFEGAHPDTRVDSSDADLVDVIHTSANHFVATLGLGMISSIGDVDFFVNGGKKQPGCWLNRGITELLARIPKRLIGKFADVLSCSHQKAQVYFTEALRSNCSFWGRLLTLSEDPETRSHTCSLQTCQQMGRHTPLFPARGTFYVRTNLEPPYCNFDPFSDYVMKYHRFGQTSNKLADENSHSGI